LPILNIFVPQVEQVPVVAGLPFFIVVDVGFLISFFALHFTQYASNFKPLSERNVFTRLTGTFDRTQRSRMRASLNS
jgi:hypothetical protein